MAKETPLPFLTSEERAKKIQEWKAHARAYESREQGFRYTANRREGDPEDPIERLHDISFLREVIPELIRRKKPGELVRILDVGAGLGFFTEQIRDAFPEKVKVYSTGLSRAAVRRDLRDHGEGQGASRKLHRHDLKWRSVFELSDYEEFDLIVDTYGELYYAQRSDQDKVGSYPQQYFDHRLKPEEPAVIERYLRAVIKKLKPGGIASLYPLMFQIDNYRAIRVMLKKLEAEFPIVLEGDIKRGLVNLKNLLRIRKLRS